MTAYHDLFIASAGILGALWIGHFALLIYMAQQRAANGIDLSLSMIMAPLGALMAGALFFAGMVGSLLSLMPGGALTHSVRLDAAIGCTIYTVAPLALLVGVILYDWSARRQVHWRWAPLFLVMPYFVFQKIVTGSGTNGIWLLVTMFGLGVFWLVFSTLWVFVFSSDWAAKAERR